MTAPVTDRPAEDERPAPERPDLLRFRVVNRLVRSRAYPLVFQLLVTAVFGLVGYELLAGPATAHRNAGTALMWVLWWPVLPLVFVLLGRFWCAVCPFGMISDVVQRLVGVGRPVPRFLKAYGIWIIDAQFLAITWGDHVWGIVESPWGSGVLLLLLTTAVIASGAFFQRRTFCRYLCFLGGLCANYGRTGMVELRADRGVCATCTARAACYHGRTADGGRRLPGCPLFTFPRTMDSTAHCNLCANCVTACPNDAIRISLRPPTGELWFLRRPKVEESFLAMAIMGIVVVQNVTMLGIWNDATAWIAATTGVTNPAAVFTVAFVVAVAAPVGLLALASWVAAAGNLETTGQNFARFGYALIPLDVAAHLAHNLFHLLAEGGSVVTTVASLVGVTSGTGPALAGPATIRALQYALLVAGGAASLYAAKRITDRRYSGAGRRRATLVPVAVLIILLAVLNAYLFTLPMSMRM